MFIRKADCFFSEWLTCSCKVFGESDVPFAALIPLELSLFRIHMLTIEVCGLCHGHLCLQGKNDSYEFIYSRARDVVENKQHKQRRKKLPDGIN